MRSVTLSFLGIRSIEANVTILVESKEKFIHCLYPGTILVFLYLGFGIYKLQTLNLAITSAASSQSNRLPYIIVMYLSLELVLILSAYRTFQAMCLLHMAGPILTASEFEKIFLKTRDSLIIAILWVCVYFLGDGILSVYQSLRDWLS
ncbi:MAG: hypothetical protein A3I66_11065 [Burkholderiales bacterium RIFCSPLOWO2_02_FULL_57_36]|nr:MAG: hypothetical protein A3I66_11065 [Burkholderiales bacterium RIFCSPLOWO2_02_FULL_57_36]